MIRMAWFERRGPWVALLTDREDGDFHYDPTVSPRLDRFLEMARWPGSGRVVRVKQMHGVRTLCLPGWSLWEAGQPVEDEASSEESSADRQDCRPVADAVASGEPGWTLGISVADCLPVWLGDPEIPCVSLIHAGRRGALAGIAEKVAAALSARYGARPRRMVAAIGPGAGPCCYEIDAETADTLRMAGHPVSGRNLDLWEVVRRSLIAAGLLRENIYTAGICTICSGQFFSYRRGDLTERNLALTALLPETTCRNPVLQ
ncbi:MAG TPA: polyphenol oxidase family protein [Candidatus Hydrogenedentes bacterium]|nr:polyphenol oxidase family protein [Candidatus Hydrogenedentota bacterium]HPU98322.1 polyphenol oxidase family protein [Candidatus Hydrogenedentota bacterium]